MNIGIELVQDLKIRQRREGEILGVCPVCGCRDANFNVDKLVWRCFDESALITTDNGIIPIKHQNDRYNSFLFYLYIFKK